MTVIPPQSLISALFTKNVADLRARGTQVAQESVTGRYADLTKHLSGNIGKAMIGHKALEDIYSQRDQLSLRAGRLEIMQHSLGGIQERSVDVEMRMFSALGTGDTVSRNLAAKDARAALQDTFMALNGRYGERYLFSGDATSTLPVTDLDTLLNDMRQIALTAATPADFEAMIDTYFNDPAGGWNTTIYRGTPSASDPEAVTAADPAIVELISGLAVLAISGTGENLPLLEQNQELIRMGAERVGTGRTALINLRSDLGVMQERIATQVKSLETQETILTAVFNDLTGRDAYAAASELKLIEASLEASYMLTARLSQLNLLNFLR